MIRRWDGFCWAQTERRLRDFGWKARSILAGRERNRWIPYGTVTTYGAIAGKIAEKRNRPSMSAQAVGGAVGHNPISIIIPCHRVVGAGGSLTGYAGGVERKRWLLELEGGWGRGKTAGL